ncbi:MAG TPA: hypothetical protein ENN45_04295, partial [Bacteroidetes bacterium]|nr:hypothetical protein [Bacteroidota bacterium]
SKKLNALISEKKLNIELYAKPWHDYVGGEETAVINSMLGHRVEPSIKPPYPTTHGFENYPTLVNNCETFYAVSQIKNNEYSNTRFYCYSEFTNEEYLNQKVLELPIDTSVKSALLEFNHTPSDECFYQVGGGAAGTCYNFKQLNRKFNSLTSIVIYPQNLPEKDIILHWANYFVNESCGQCVPCREGTYRLCELLEKYYATNKLDKKNFDDVIFSLQNTSLCPVGQISANAILSYWKNVKK